MLLSLWEESITPETRSKIVGSSRMWFVIPKLYKHQFSLWGCIFILKLTGFENSWERNSRKSMKTFPMSLSWRLKTMCLWPKVSDLMKRDERRQSIWEPAFISLLVGFSHFPQVLTYFQLRLYPMRQWTRTNSIPELHDLVILSKYPSSIEKLIGTMLYHYSSTLMYTCLNVYTLYLILYNLSLFWFYATFFSLKATAN